MTVKNLLLALLLLASFLAWRWFDAMNEPPLVSTFDPSRPDFIAKNLYNVAYDESGKLSYRIFADAMSHFEQQKQTLFEHPVVLVYPEEIRPIWQLKANTGILQGEEVEQGGDVSHKESSKDADASALDKVAPATEAGKLLKVTLNDDVKIINLTNNEYVKQITTSKIELDLKTQTIQTQAKVFIEGPTYDLQGVGLIGNLSQEQVDLLDEVHGIYNQE